MKKLILLIIIPLFFFNGCIEDISVKIPDSERKIVIEGKIESGKYAEVFVLHSNPLSSTGSFKDSAFVFNAKIYVFDGILTDTLFCTYNVSNPFASQIHPESAYWTPYIGKKIIGTPGKTYYLTVEAEGNTYTAVTTIPAPLALDSVWWKKVSDEQPGLGYAWGRLSEPAGLGNAYRWSAKRSNAKYATGESADRRYLSPVGATFDDKLIDGKTLDFYYSRGVDPTDPYAQNHQKEFVYEFKKSDTIFIKFSTIDQNTAKFYATYETAYANNGNPFASPVNVQTNIVGGGLGVWAGFGCTYDTIIPQP